MRPAASIVDQHVDRRAACLLDLGNPCRRLWAIGEIDYFGCRALLLRDLKTLCPGIAAEHPRARFEEPFRHTPSKPVARASDDDDPVVEADIHRADLYLAPMPRLRL